MATDIDFDELDKAVSSLMGSAGNQPPKEDDEDHRKTNTLAINATLKPNEIPTYDVLGKAAEKIGGETIADISDKADVKNIGSASSAETPKVATAASEQPVAQPETPPPGSTNGGVKRPDSGRFMDMVHPSADMRPGASTPGVTIPEPATKSPASSEIPRPVASSSTNSSSSSPLSGSPFLPDAKVEKRPLGGDTPQSAANESPAPAEEVAETKPVNNEEKKTVDGTEDEQRPLDASHFDVEAALQDQKLQAIESADTTQSSSSPDPLTAVESADADNLSPDAPTPSAEEPTEPSDASGAIYDVNNYHQPLSHPAKQKSGWGVIVVILVIIVLAAAAAGAAYFIFAKP